MTYSDYSHNYNYDLYIVKIEYSTCPAAYTCFAPQGGGHAPTLHRRGAGLPAWEALSPTAWRIATQTLVPVSVTFFYCTRSSVPSMDTKHGMLERKLLTVPFHSKWSGDF